MTRQPLAHAPVVFLALQQHGAAALELFGEQRHGLAGLRHRCAMGFGLAGRGVDIAGAVADRGDEIRCDRGVAGHLAGGLALFCNGGIDVAEYRADRVDGGRDAMHRLDGIGGVLLQGIDLALDFLGGVLRLHRQRLHFRCDHSEAATGLAGARRLDGGIERQQRGLLGDGGDQVDDIADRRRGFPQAIDIGAGLARRVAGLIGELAGFAYLGVDAVSRVAELVGGLRKGRGSFLRGAGVIGQRIGALADRRQRRGGGLRAGSNGRSSPFELPDHGAEFKLEQVENVPGRILRGLGGRRRRSEGRRGRCGNRCGRRIGHCGNGVPFAEQCQCHDENSRSGKFRR